MCLRHTHPCSVVVPLASRSQTCKHEVSRSAARSPHCDAVVPQVFFVCLDGIISHAWRGDAATEGGTVSAVHLKQPVNLRSTVAMLYPHSASVFQNIACFAACQSMQARISDIFFVLWCCFPANIGDQHFHKVYAAEIAASHNDSHMLAAGVPVTTGRAPSGPGFGTVGQDALYVLICLPCCSCKIASHTLLSKNHQAGSSSCLLQNQRTRS